VKRARKPRARRRPAQRKPRGGRRFLIVSGLSGAGKSVVLNTLEDLEFYCIDNLPVNLLERLGDEARSGAGGLPRNVAAGVDARSPEAALRALPETLETMRAEGVLTEVVFVEANDDVLTKRFSETRRRHPLSSARVALPDAIRTERRLMGPVSELADLRIDTSFTAVHELRDLVRERVARRASAEISIQLISFGYKHGTPRDADFVFDVRCLPNPHWDRELRKFSGREQPVVDFLLAQDLVRRMLEDLKRFLDRWIPRFEAENRSYMCIAIGCTGGHHRSVFLIEQLAAHLRRGGRQIIVKHRDLWDRAG
jgi:UPF0042 nucleotide-binding protein